MSTDSRIRLALCITELEVGGAERCLVELATRIDRDRFDPVVYSLGPRPRPEQAALVARLEQAGVPVHFLNGRSLFSAPRVLLRLTQLLRAQRPQIVQTFLFHANVMGAVAARLAGVRCVVSGIRVAERRQAWHLRWARLVDCWVTRHVCVSQSVADFSSTAGGLDRSRLVVIPNGVDVERFRGALPCSAESLAVGVGRRVIAFVGRLERQKGPEWLIDLAPRMLSQLPEHDLVIVGQGPLRLALEDATRRLDERDRIHFVGWRDDIPEILAAAEIVVLPSQWEGMPNVLLEAMAAARPVVATCVEGVAESLGPNDHGQAVSIDPQSFVDTVVKIACLRSAQGRIGQANRARAEQEFSLGAMVARYERLYLTLAKAGDSRHEDARNANKR